MPNFVRTTSVLLLALAIALCSACSTPGVNPQGAVDLCTIAGNPSEFSGRTVLVAGTAMAAPHYVTAFFSDSCTDRKFALATTSAVETSPNYVSLRKILWGSYPERTPTATVELIARFEYRPNDIPTRVLSVSSIESAEPSPAGD